VSQSCTSSNSKTICAIMRTLIITFITILISGCSGNADLGNSYYYLDTFEAIDVGYPYGAIIYKGDTENHFDTTIISREVVQVIRTQRYIFAKQIASENKLDTNCYVIDKTTDKVFGPVKTDSFAKLKNSLTIDE
jgi:di/tripeptidase